jgi:hypothetical protein
MLELGIACDSGIPARVVDKAGIGQAKVFRLDGTQLIDTGRFIQVINVSANSIAPRQAFWFTVIENSFYVVAPA